MGAPTIEVGTVVKGVGNLNPAAPAGGFEAGDDIYIFVSTDGNGSSNGLSGTDAANYETPPTVGIVSGGHVLGVYRRRAANDSHEIPTVEISGESQQCCVAVVKNPQVNTAPVTTVITATTGDTINLASLGTPTDPAIGLLFFSMDQQTATFLSTPGGETLVDSATEAADGSGGQGNRLGVFKIDVAGGLAAPATSAQFSVNQRMLAAGILIEGDSSASAITLTTEPQTLGFSGQDIALAIANVMPVDPQALTLSGLDMALNIGSGMAINPETLTFVGGDLALAKVLPLEAQTLTLTGATLNLPLDRGLSLSQQPQSNEPLVITKSGPWTGTAVVRIAGNDIEPDSQTGSTITFNTFPQLDELALPVRYNDDVLLEVEDSGGSESLNVQVLPDSSRRWYPLSSSVGLPADSIHADDTNIATGDEVYIETVSGSWDSISDLGVIEGATSFLVLRYRVFDVSENQWSVQATETFSDSPLPLDLTPQTLSFSGVDLAYNAAPVLTLDPQSLTLSGADVAMSLSASLTLEPQSLTLTGGNMSIFSQLALEIDAQTLTLDGQDVGLVAGSVLTLEPELLDLVGAELDLAPGRLLTLEAGSLALTGSDLALQDQSALAIESQTLEFAGNELALQSGTQLQIEPETLRLISGDLRFDSVLELTLAPKTLAIRGQSLEIGALPPLVPLNTQLIVSIQ